VLIDFEAHIMLMRSLCLTFQGVGLPILTQSGS